MEDPRAEDKIIKRWIEVQRFGNSLGRDLKKRSRVLMRDINKIVLSKKLTQLQKNKRIKDTLKKSKADTNAFIISELLDFGNSVLKGAKSDAELLGVGKLVEKTKVTEADIKRMIKSHSLNAQKGTLGQQINNSYERIYKSSKANISKDVSSSKDDDFDLVQLSAAVANSNALHMEVLAVTATNSIYNSVYELTFDKVNKVRYLWVSTLDHVTSDFCKVADGKIFKKGKGPRPPAHIGCRSIIVVILADEDEQKLLKTIMPRAAVVPKSVKALEEKGLTTRTGKKRRPSKSNSSPLRGKRINKRDYEEYLRSQPKLYIQKILGKKDAEKFRAGNSLLSVLKKSKTKTDFSSIEQAINL